MATYHLFDKNEGNYYFTRDADGTIHLLKGGENSEEASVQHWSDMMNYIPQVFAGSDAAAYSQFNKNNRRHRWKML